MSDIDFDELDREVSKLVGDTDSSTVPVTVTPKEEVVTGDATDDIATVTRRGRFMDVMHPSSDMATKEEASAASQLSDGAERQTIEPIDTIEPESAHVETEEQPKLYSTDMPDPIDVHESRQQVETPQEDSYQSELVDSSEPDTPTNTIDNVAPNDPFVVDAKVEKRPLGQFSDDTSLVEEAPSPEPTVTQDDNPDNIATNSTQYSLPPELEKDLVAIEAGKSPDDILSADDVTNNDSQEDDLTISEEGQLGKEEESKEDAPSDRQLSESSAALLASGSIPQQYKLAIKEKAGIKDDTSSQLFQAEHYDTSPGKATKHKSKATSALMWFFIVVGILLLGGVIGYAVFGFVSSQ